MARLPSFPVAALAAALLLITPLVAAQEVILQNDSFTSGAVGFQAGFATGDIGAVRLVPPGPFPMPLTKVQFLFGGDPGTGAEAITLHIWDDSAGTLTPGAELFSKDYFPSSSNTALQEIDLSAEGISITGPIRVGLEFLQDGLPCIARDNDGTITASRNFIYSGGTWVHSSDFFVAGDWIIRAVVSTGTVIFQDGFETGGIETGPAGWSAVQAAGGHLSVTGAARMAGTDYGLQAFVENPSPAFVEDDRPNQEPRYHARFYFDPNGFDPGQADGHLRTRIFIVFTNPTRRVAAVVLKRQGDAFSLMGRAKLDDGSQADTGFVGITDGPHYVEIDLKQSSGPDANDGSFQMWIDGVPAGTTRTGLDNNLAAVDFVRMGALSVKTGALGTLFWDEFKSKKSGAIGP